MYLRTHVFITLRLGRNLKWLLHHWTPLHSGGFTRTGVSQECYRLKNCDWTKANSSKVGLRFAAAVQSNVVNDAYVIGGEDGQGRASNSVHKLDDDGWSAALPHPVTRHCAVEVNAEVFIAGGHVGVGVDVSEDRFSTRSFRFDLKSKETHSVENMIQGKTKYFCSVSPPLAIIGWVQSTLKLKPQSTHS